MLVLIAFLASLLAYAVALFLIHRHHTNVVRKHYAAQVKATAARDARILSALSVPAPALVK